MLTRRGLLLQVARVLKKEPVSGIYIPGWKAVGSKQTNRIADVIERLGLNALLVDLKDANGDIFYQADDPTGRKLQAKTVDGHPRSLNFRALRALQRRGIRVLGRHVMFRDRGLYHEQPNLQLHQTRNEYWVDPRRWGALDYNLALLEQEETFGFDELVLDYIRFPAVNRFGSLDQKCDHIDRAVAEAHCRVSTLGVQVFGWAAWDYRKAGVGQRIPTLDAHVDHVYPMVYPSHFQSGSFGFADPNEHPKFILKAGYREGSKKVSSAAKIMPMVQVFWHKSEQVRAQIEAVEEADMPGYLAWNARGNYDLLEEALKGRSASGENVVHDFAVDVG